MVILIKCSMCGKPPNVVYRDPYDQTPLYYKDLGNGQKIPFCTPRCSLEYMQLEGGRKKDD